RSISAKGEDLLPAYLHAGGNTGLAEIIRTSEWRAGSFSAVAGFELGRQPPVPGLLCIGDAESMIPPFTGNGMSMAFQAAEHTLAPLHHWARGTATWNETANTVRHHLRKTFRRRLAVARALHGV